MYNFYFAPDVVPMG
jgi:hypothetical protein